MPFSTVLPLSLLDWTRVSGWDLSISKPPLVPRKRGVPVSPGEKPTRRNQGKFQTHVEVELKTMKAQLEKLLFGFAPWTQFGISAVVWIFKVPLSFSTYRLFPNYGIYDTSRKQLGGSGDS